MEGRFAVAFIAFAANRMRRLKLWTRAKGMRGC